MDRSFLASSSVKLHYIRGTVGLLALVAAIVGASAGIAAALALLVVTVAAWRGCPTCWAVGLMHTRDCESCQARGGPAGVSISSSSTSPMVRC